MESKNYSFAMPEHHKSIIKVIGVGGGGSNAVNHMYSQGIKDVEFIVCNTDAQALKSSPVPNKLQIGLDLTEGLGAGANPEKGRNAALESKEEIREMLTANTKMLFVTAGMGGGTGTGAAPVISEVARELDILTVGIVTSPFSFEGKRKRKQAEEGIAELRAHCDTVLVIMNDKLREMHKELSVRKAFAQADNVLTTAAKSIAEIITVTSDVNVDFEDVRTVMKESGAAVMGSATTSGEGRARRAAEEALSSPLLNNTDIHGAKKILLSIMSGEEAELGMDELTEITDFIEEQAGDDADVIFGHGIDDQLGECIRVTVIATGFMDESPREEKRKVIDLESNRQIKIFENEKTKKEALSHFTVREEPQRPTPASSPVAATPRDERPVEKPVEYHFDKEEVPTEETRPEPVAASSRDTSDEDLTPEQKREKFRKIYSERIAKLKGLSRSLNSSESIKEKLNRPAYERRNVDLQDVPHSSEKRVSRYNLNDDNELLGGNKFLHDNVD